MSPKLTLISKAGNFLQVTGWAIDGAQSSILSVAVLAGYVMRIAKAQGQVLGFGV